MEYTVSDVAELFDEGGIDVYKIRKVGKIWGSYEGDVWVGGICFKSRSGEYCRVSRVSVDCEVEVEESDTQLYPLSQDYEDHPVDIVDWIRDGGRLEDSCGY